MQPVIRGSLIFWPQKIIETINGKGTKDNSDWDSCIHVVRIVENDGYFNYNHRSVLNN